MNHGVKIERYVRLIETKDAKGRPVKRRKIVFGVPGPNGEVLYEREKRRDVVAALNRKRSA